MMKRFLINFININLRRMFYKLNLTKFTKSVKKYNIVIFLFYIHILILKYIAHK